MNARSGIAYRPAEAAKLNDGDSLTFISGFEATGQSPRLSCRAHSTRRSRAWFAASLLSLLHCEATRLTGTHRHDPFCRYAGRFESRPSRQGQGEAASLPRRRGRGAYFSRACSLNGCAWWLRLDRGSSPSIGPTHHVISCRKAQIRTDRVWGDRCIRVIETDIFFRRSFFV